MSESKSSSSSSPRRFLYPEISPYSSGFLPVSSLHTIYYEEAGNPKGKPAVVVHGGPGGGIADYYRQFFDPAAYRIILFDQRGCGKSTPNACLEENTTWDLVEDMEKLRKTLKVDKWLVFGGSWGSTLSLAYAEKYPSVVTELVLRGIFLVRPKEIDWLYQEGANYLFPDGYEDYIAPIPLVERHHLLSAFHRRLTGNNDKEKLDAAKAWSVWEMTTSRLFIDPKTIARAADDAVFAIQFARIECHYFVNGAFFKTEDQLLTDAKAIANIPGVIVQGRYDIVCPMVSAWELSKVWKKGELKVVPDAGHSAKEDGIIHELVTATDRFRGQ